MLTVLALLLTVGAFLAYSGKVHLIRALRDCKQRSLTVSKKAPTVSKKASPNKFSFWGEILATTVYRRGRRAGLPHLGNGRNAV